MSKDTTATAQGHTLFKGKKTCKIQSVDPQQGLDRTGSLQFGVTLSTLYPSASHVNINMNTLESLCSIPPAEPTEMCRDVTCWQGSLRNLGGSNYLETHTHTQASLSKGKGQPTRCCRPRELPLWWQLGEMVSQALFASSASLQKLQSFLQALNVKIHVFEHHYSQAV